MNKAFTLIETLVVILVTMILASIMIVYSHTGEKQIVLFRDQAKVVGILNRAKFLSVQMFSKTIDDKTCAYGVHFELENEAKSFSIFKVKALTSNCENSYIAGGNNIVKVEEYSLDSRLKFSEELTGITDIVFIPPDPKVILTGTSDNSAKITIVDISDTSGKNKKEINVNTFGQITAQ